MARARLERTIRFRARHHYRLADRSEAENRALFGELVDPHPHDWVVTFVFEGEMAPVTGFCVDLPRVETVLEEVTRGWHGGDLNELVPEAGEGTFLPSCEGLARWLHERVSAALSEAATLVRVRVAESDEIAAAYPASLPSGESG